MLVQTVPHLASQILSPHAAVFALVLSSHGNFTLEAFAQLKASLLYSHQHIGAWCSYSQSISHHIYFTPHAKLHLSRQPDQDTHCDLAQLHSCMHRARSLLHFTGSQGSPKHVLSPQQFQQLGKQDVKKCVMRGRCFYHCTCGVY